MYLYIINGVGSVILASRFVRLKTLDIPFQSSESLIYFREFVWRRGRQQ